MRTLLLVAALTLVPSARADVSDSGNLLIGGNGVIAGTMTVQGAAFSVGGATLAVAGGSVGIGTTSPAAPLDVTGAIHGTSSATASAFFGDGSHLTGIAPGESNTYSSSKTFTSNLQVNGYVTLIGTAAVQGNAFSVGASSFTVTGGSAAVAYSMTAGSFVGNATTASALKSAGSKCSSGNVSIGVDASGNCLAGFVDTAATSGSTNTITSGAMFSALAGKQASGSYAASGANSDITSLGALKTVSNPFTATSSMTNTSAGGILSSSSVTASAFFGDGSHLTGVISGSESNTFSASSKTFSGGNVLIASPYSLQATSGTFTYNISVGSLTITSAAGIGLVNASTITTGGRLYISTSSTSSSPEVVISSTSGGSFAIGVSTFSVGTASFTVAGGSATVAYSFGAGSLNSSGQTTTASTETVKGNAFSVGGSTLIVTGGNVGIGTTPSSAFHVQSSTASANAVIIASGSATAQYLMVVSTGGNVGIGTTSPGAALDVGGQVFAGGVPASFGEIHTPLVVKGDPIGRGIRLYTGDYNNVNNGSGFVIGFVAGSSNTVSTLQAYISGSSEYGNLGINPSGGKVGIGTTSPTHLLEVNGNAANTTGVWATISDKQFKANINPIRDALDTVRKLQGVTFQWNARKIQEVIYPEKWKKNQKRGSSDYVVTPNVDSGSIRGFIAQDVEQVVPEWVRSDPRGFKWLEPAGIEAVVVEAIKQVDGENEALTRRVEAQQKEIDDLTARMKALEKGAPVKRSN